MKLPAGNLLLLTNPKLKSIGWVLSILLMLWIAWILFQEREQLRTLELDLQFGIAATIATGVVVLGNFLGSVAMRVLLKKHSPEFSLSVSIIINGVAQLAKYLPGNVLHLIGRYLYIQRLTTAKIALWFSIFEILLLSLAAAALGTLYLHYLQPQLWPSSLVGLLAPLVIAAGIAILTKLQLLDCKPKDLACVVVLYLISYVCYGFGFSQLMQHGFGQENPGVLLCASLFALAFLGGYVTPGASGGIGVREFLMMILATPLLDGTAVLATAVLFRFFSIAGDLLFGLVALAVKAQRRQPVPR